MSSVLVLNASYQVLGAVDWTKAIVLVFQEKAEVIEDHPNKMIRSPKLTLKMPSVIRLLRYVKRKLVPLRFNKSNVYFRDNGKCCYCGESVTRHKMSIDHVLPKSRGGLTNWENVVLACRACNARKDNKTPEEAGMPLLHNPSKPDMIHLDKLHQLGSLPKRWEKWIIK